jgi:Glycosyl transferases group 1
MIAENSGDGVPETRKSISVISDRSFAILENVVSAHLESLQRQLPFVTEVKLICAKAQKAPQFSGQVRIKTISDAAIQSRQKKLPRRLLRSFQRKLGLTEQKFRWITDIADFEETALRGLMGCRNDHAVVIFTQSAELALKVARYIHMFSAARRPHIVCVTSRAGWPERELNDLSWLGVSIAADQDLGTLSTDAINSIGALPSRELNWKGLAPGAFAYPPRVSKIVLFARPDWGSCGSGTYFGSLAEYFRRSDALMIDIAIHPYGRLKQEEIKLKLEDEKQFMRPAAYFSLRRTKAWTRYLTDFGTIIRFLPRTVSNQMLLSYVLTAKPDLLRDVLNTASITHVYLNHYFLYGYFHDFLKSRRFHLDTHDIQALNAVAAGYKNAFTRKTDDYKKMLDEEMSILRRAERLSFVSLTELATAKEFLPESKLMPFIALPNVKPLPEKPLSAGPEFSLLFVASYNPPNQRNIDWFMDFVWPKLQSDFSKAQSKRKSRPAKVVLHVCGGIKNYIGNRETPENIIFHGIVDRLEPHYANADLVILPVVTGAGAAMKTIEAMLHERPVVGTQHAFRGLPTEIEETIGSHNSPEGLAAAILAPLLSKERYKEACRNTRKGAQILRDQDYFGRLTTALEAVRLPERYPSQ